jgi:magnesium-transporting ATPase (P-type)
VYNCSARIEKGENGEVQCMGNVTEQGLLRFLMDVGVPCYEKLLAKVPHILQLIPFNSSRKRACTAIRRPENAN